MLGLDEPVQRGVGCLGQTPDHAAMLAMVLIGPPAIAPGNRRLVRCARGKPRHEFFNIL